MAHFGGSITNTHINGDVSGGFKVGGLAGSDGFSLQNAIEPCLDVECIDPGNIISTGGVIQNSYINGNVTGSLKVGGLTSLNIGEISSSQIRGNVTGDTKVGGLTALNLNSIYNSNINGNVIGSYWVGGLTATNFGSIDSSYIRGNVSGDGKVGTLSALNFGSITNSYQYSPSQEQPFPQDIALSDIDNLLKKKIPKKINSDELINYEAIRSNIIVRAKVIIH
jgi:hypothetical protein